MSRPLTQDHMETVKGDRFHSELEGAQFRGEETLGLVYKAFVFRIFRYCLRLGLSEPDAEDASHEVVLRVDQALATVRSGEPIWPWIASITRNYITDEWRKSKRLQPLDTVIDLSDASSLEEEVLRRGRIRLMHRSLAQLSSIDRTMIVMRDLHGLSYREICVAAEPRHPVHFGNR